MKFKGSHILSVNQFNLEGIYNLFKVADVMTPYALRTKKTRVLEGAILGNLFLKQALAQG